MAVLTINRHEFYRPEYQDAQVAPVCDEHLIDCEWDDDKNCWYCPECDRLAFMESYRMDEPL